MTGAVCPAPEQSGEMGDLVSSDVVIRHAQIDDAPGIARVRAESWRAAYRGIVPDEYLDAIDVSDWSVRQRRAMENQPAELAAWVADADGLVVGWAVAGPNRVEDLPFAGELFALYLLPEYWRRGIGRLLMKAATQSLIAHGMHSMMLWVLAENWPARRFYEALGGQYVRETTISIGGAVLPEVSYGWDDLGPCLRTIGAE